MLLQSVTSESYAKTIALFRWDVGNMEGGDTLELASWLADIFDVAGTDEFWTELAAEVEAEAAKDPAAVAAAYAQEEADWAELSAILDAKNTADIIKEGGLADRLMAGEALPFEAVQHIAAFARTEAANAAAANDGAGYYAEWLPVLRKAEAVIAAMSKQQYTINILAEADNDPFTGNALPEQREAVTIEAATLEEARKLAPVFMRMTVRGQMLRFFHNGTELLGNF